MITCQHTDNLIDSLSYSLTPTFGHHNSRYFSHKDTTFTRSDSHREFLYNKYGKFGGTSSPRMPKRSTNDEGWYRAISREMGHPRSVTPTPMPILKHRDGRSPTPSRYLSNMSLRSSCEHLSRPVSPMSISRPVSPYLVRNRSVSPTRSYREYSYSPKHERSVVIGPVTDMVTKQEHHSKKQEYYRHRDAHQGKVRSTTYMHHDTFSCLFLEQLTLYLTVNTVLALVLLLTCLITCSPLVVDMAL